MSIILNLMCITEGWRMASSQPYFCSVVASDIKPTRAVVAGEESNRDVPELLRDRDVLDGLS